MSLRSNSVVEFFRWVPDDMGGPPCLEQRGITLLWVHYLQRSSKGPGGMWFGWQSKAGASKAQSPYNSCVGGWEVPAWYSWAHLHARPGLWNSVHQGGLDSPILELHMVRSSMPMWTFLWALTLAVKWWSSPQWMTGSCPFAFGWRTGLCLWFSPKGQTPVGLLCLLSVSWRGTGNCPNGFSLVLLEYFNAHMGNDSGTRRGVIRRNALSCLNPSGVLLLNFCAYHSLPIANTMLKNYVHRYT